MKSLATNCYEFQEFNFTSGFFDASVDITFIITLESNTERYKSIERQLKNFVPTKKIVIVKNKGFKNCTKYDGFNKEITQTYEDLTHANMVIFQKAEKYNNILVLEDDFIFSEKILNPKNTISINKFIKRKKPNLYCLGSIPYLINPLSLVNAHYKVYFESATLANIYSQKARQQMHNTYFTNFKLKKDIDMITNFTQKNKYLFHKPLCVQVFSETENKKTWQADVNIFVKSILKTSDFFIKRIKLDKEENIVKKHESIFRMIKFSHYLKYLTLFILLFILFTSLFSCSDTKGNTNTMTTGLSTNTFMHNNVNREYVLYVPSSYDSNTSTPLLFNFHGFGGQARAHFDYTNMQTIADSENVILVYPQGTLLDGSSHWNSGLDTDSNKSSAEDFGFIVNLINELASNYTIDRNRVYAIGYSNGAFFSYALACYHSDKIAGVGSVAGTMQIETYENCNPSHPTAMINIHGTLDSAVPYNGGGEGLQSISGAVNYWVNYNRTNTTPVITTKTENGVNIERYLYSNGTNNTSVAHYKIVDGGHVWFNITYDGASTSQLLWNFLSRYDKNGERN